MNTPNEAIASLENLASSAPSAQVDFNVLSQEQLAWLDLKEGLLKWRIWAMLAYQDIKLRYRRSLLGPFWITLSMAITVYSMGFLYGKLFHQDLQRYYPFLVSGMLSWSLISTIVTDLTDGFSSSEGVLKGIKLPYSLFIHRIAMRNFIIFFHNIIVIVPVLLLFHKYATVNLKTLLLIPGLIITYINTITYGLLIALVGARFRDVSQVIKSLVQVVFFITPVMWPPQVVAEVNHWIIDLNPFYGFIECVRAPLMGNAPTMKNLIMVAAMTTIGFMFSFKVFQRYRSRIIYWL